MKQLIISAIALALLSTTMAGIAANQDAVQGKIKTEKEVSALATLKNAFKFGLQTGWQKPEK